MWARPNVTNKPAAIFKFIAIDGLINGKQFKKYQTCVVDDDLAALDACSVAKLAEGMLIRKGQSFGRTREVSVTYPLTDAEFQSLLDEASDYVFDLKLSVNSLISEEEASLISVVKGINHLNMFDWFNENVFPSPVILYSAAPSTFATGQIT